MKLVNLSLLLQIMLLVHSGYAQRHIKGQNAVSFTAGVVDNFPKFSTPHAPGRGYAGSIDYIWYRKNERYWKTSFNYIRKYYDALTAKKPVVEQYWLAIDYVPRGIYTTRRWLYVAPTAGLYVGYEAVNRNQLDLPEGIIQNQSTASIGPQAGLEGEAYVSPSLVLIVGITERFIPFSEVSQFRTTGYIGIRFCFFR